MNWIHRLPSFLRSPKVIVASLVTLTGISVFSFGLPHVLRGPAPMRRYLISKPMRSPYDARETIGWLSHNGFDVAGFNWQRGTIEVITDDEGIKTIEAHGLRGLARGDQFLAPGLQSIDPRYLNPQRTEETLKALNARFPNLTRLEQIGTSLQGRPIWALLVSTTPKANDPAALEKPSIIFDGLHHAREIMTPEIVMDVAQTVLSGTQMRVRAATDLLSRWNIWVVPMLNVDGNNIVWTQDAWWRKNARGTNGSGIYGVDINRNYPFQFAACAGSSNRQGAQDYHGASGGSEPETQALARLGQMARPSASLSYHSYSELVLYPFGCSGELSGENAMLEKISRELAAVLPSDSGRGNYTPGTPWQILYGVDGDSMSYLHSEFGATAFTFEVNQEFEPPYSLREPTLVKHRKAWQYFLARLDANMLAIKVIDGRTNRPAVANIDISTIAHKYGEKPFQTNAAGNYFKALEPGRYAIRAVLADGRVTETSLEMRGQPQATQVVVP